MSAGVLQFSGFEECDYSGLAIRAFHGFLIVEGVEPLASWRSSRDFHPDGFAFVAHDGRAIGLFARGGLTGRNCTRDESE